MARSNEPRWEPAAIPLAVTSVDVPNVARWRLRLDRRFSVIWERPAHFVAIHWLALLNGAIAMFLALPFLAPLLMARGLTTPATWIYSGYQVVCHQWAFRSFFLFGQQAVYPPETLRALVGDSQLYNFVGNSQLGYKVAFCERDVAIYCAIVLVGIGYTAVRGRLQPPSLTLLGILLLPIAVDGFTQLFGLRESTWELRVVTGTLFGVAAVWLIYPQLERSAQRAKRSYGLA